MDRPISMDEAGERFPDIIRDVANGESYLVTDDGSPVARISPAVVTFTDEELKQQAIEARRLAAELAKRPIIITGPWTRDELYDT